jgi:hypothetical protein
MVTLFGIPGNVGRYHRVGKGEELLVAPRGLHLENVDTRAADHALLEYRFESRNIHDGSSRGIDQNCVRLHRSQRCVVDHVVRLVGEGAVDCDVVRSGEEVR